MAFGTTHAFLTSPGMERDAAEAHRGAHKKAMESFPLLPKAQSDSKVPELISRLTACLGGTRGQVKWSIHSRSCTNPIVWPSSMNRITFFTSSIWMDAIIPKTWNRVGWDIP